VDYITRWKINIQFYGDKTFGFSLLNYHLQIFIKNSTEPYKAFEFILEACPVSLSALRECALRVCTLNEFSLEARSWRARAATNDAIRLGLGGGRQQQVLQRDEAISLPLSPGARVVNGLRLHFSHRAKLLSSLLH